MSIVNTLGLLKVARVTARAKLFGGMGTYTREPLKMDIEPAWENLYVLTEVFTRDIFTVV